MAGWLPRLARWLFWPTLALVIWGELTPQLPDFVPHAPDKVLHFTAYFVLAALAVLFLRTRGAAVGAILGLVALGGMLEILQGLTGRDPEWLDELANACGAGLGAIAGFVLNRLVGPGPPD